MRQSDAFLKSTAKVRQFLYICKFFANNFSPFSKKQEKSDTICSISNDLIVGVYCKSIYYIFGIAFAFVWKNKCKKDG